MNRRAREGNCHGDQDGGFPDISSRARAGL